MFIYKTTQANHSSEFEWLGLEPSNYGPSKFRTRSVFEPPLYCQPKFQSNLRENWCIRQDWKLRDGCVGLSGSFDLRLVDQSQTPLLRYQWHLRTVSAWLVLEQRWKSPSCMVSCLKCSKDRTSCSKCSKDRISCSKCSKDRTSCCEIS